jgi:endonuclease YncB( thermonuclease family)
MFIKFLTIIVATITVLYGGWSMLESALDELIVGRASVIDGDTLMIGTERVHLFGVDAPALDQVCDYKGRRWLCGEKSAIDLAAWIGTSTVICRRRGNAYDGNLGSCLKGHADIADWSVSRGLSIAEIRGPQRYVAHQERARGARAGIWSSTFVPRTESRPLLREPARSSTAAR